MITVKVKIKKTKQEVVIESKQHSGNNTELHHGKKQVAFTDERKQQVQTNTAAQMKTVYEIQTKPLLSDVWLDFMGMIDMFINSVSRIRRIDEIVIP